jgi:hypothetical protein
MNGNDSKKRPSPIKAKKPAGVSRRLDRGTGTWAAASVNTAFLQAMLAALKRKAAR